MARLPDTGNLPDRERSSAVLIGVSSYTEPELPELPAVRNNVYDLASLLTDPTTGILRQDRCMIMSDPGAAIDIAHVLERETRRSDDMLLVYYAGHGLIGNDGELYLGVSDTRHESLAFTALHYASIRDILLRSRARVIVVILDCCFSGRALANFMSHMTESIADQAAISGTYVLASSSPSSLALARPGDPYTAFTGEFIRILKEGIPDGPALLTLSAIFSELRRTLAALGYPAPQQRGSNNVSQFNLARNAAALAVRVAEPQSTEADAGAATASVMPDEGVSAGSFKNEDEIEWTADEPSREDLLHRGFLADVIAMRLIETQDANPCSSFCVHVDGPWGSGKSTLLNLLDDRLTPYFRLVRFDAWQQARLSPPWWSLLTATRREVVRGRRWWARPSLRIQETGARIRRTGAPYLFAMSLIVITSTIIGYLIVHRVAMPKSWGSSAQAGVALLAVLGTLGTGIVTLSRLLLWDTARGARLFEQSQANPLGDIAAHFRWLLMRSDRPVAFFIDDLDRCPGPYVVEFLDTLQTLVRGSYTGDAAERAAYFVLAADGAWLRRSYEIAYTSFSDCLGEAGRPLGYLFLDKFFQLAIPMPALAGPAQRLYLDHMLRVDVSVASDTEKLGEDELTRPARADGEAIRDRLRLFYEGRSRQAVELLTNPASRQRTEHALRKFAPLLGHNPRSVKKFINTFSILRAIRTLEGNFVDSDSLALWVILQVRWPELADHLQRFPDAVAGIIDPLWCSDHFPGPMRDLARSSELRAIVTHPSGGPLTSSLILQCCGIIGD